MIRIDECRHHDLFCQHLRDLGQFISRIDPEIIHELSGGNVNQGFTYHVFISAGDDDQFFFKQLLNRVITVHPPDGFDLGFGDGLFVGDDGQCLECSGRQSLQKLVAIQLCNGLVVILFGQKLPSPSAFAQLKRIEFCSIFFFDAFDGGFYLVDDNLIIHEAKGLVDQFNDFQ